MPERNLLDILKAGKRNVRRVKWPGTDVEIGITVLTEQEIQDATFAVEQLFKAKDIEITAMTIGPHASEQSTQILARALVDLGSQRPDGTYEPYFKSVDELRSVLRREAKDALIEEYNAFDAECSPSPDKMTPEQFEEIVAGVKKTRQIGSNSSFATLRSLIIYLVDRQTALQKVSGSTSTE